jgi:two-component system cell cycle response regulator
MRILIAEDDAIFRRILQSTLGKWGYEVITANDGARAWEILQQENPPKLVLLDWVMPELDGVEVCRLVRAQKDKPYTYILLLTAKDKKEDMITALEAGVDDFVSKPFDSMELRGRLRAGKRIIKLQDELLAARAELQYTATHDSLTGILNRPAILQEFARSLARVERSCEPIAVALADVDHFKLINDTHGHIAGDMVLKEISHRMNQCVRPYDCIGRYGGEEFLLAFEGCDLQGAAHCADRLRNCINHEPVLADGKAVGVTISIGIAFAENARPEDSAALIRLADEALYDAKKSGRDRCVLMHHISRNEPVAATPKALN